MGREIKMKDKTIRRILFGGYDTLEKPHRSCVITFPAKDENDVRRKITCAGDDGIILYLLKRIEKNESRIRGFKAVIREQKSAKKIAN